MHPNTTKRTKTWGYSPMGWIWCVHCQKLRCDFVARTFALIAPVQPVLHRVSCSNETIQNAPKHYKMHQYMSFDSNEADRVCSLWKILMRLHGTNLCINCNGSTYFAPSLPSAPKHYETHQNMSLGSNWVDWVRSLRKIPMRLHATNLCINCTISAHFASSFVQ